MMNAPVFHDVRPAMGTDFEIWLEAADTTRAEELFEVAFEEIERLDASLSTYRETSEISRINRRASAGPVTTDSETFRILQRSRACSDQTSGAFDITVGRLMRAWGFFRDRGSYPSDSQLAEALMQTGWSHLELDPHRRTVAFRRQGMLLDLGACGKGYALDSAAGVLRSVGVEAALLSAGKSTYVAIGALAAGDSWRVNIPDPVDRERTISSLGLRNAALSTSGSYEKFFILDGERYCHIVDPRSGRPVRGMLQATVLAADGESSDMLSTAAFVSGTAGAAAILGEASDNAIMMVAGDAERREVFSVRWPDGEVVGLPDRDRIR